MNAPPLHQVMRLLEGSLICGVCFIIPKPRPPVSFFKNERGEWISCCAECEVRMRRIGREIFIPAGQA